MTAECGFDGCKNQRFQSFNECALHCEKKYDACEELNAEFHKLLLHKLFKTPTVMGSDVTTANLNKVYNILIKNNKPDELLESWKPILSKWWVVITNIKLPTLNNILKNNFLSYVSKVQFRDCDFLRPTEIDKVDLSFVDCYFKKDPNRNNLCWFLNIQNTMYINCVFEDEVTICNFGKDLIGKSNKIQTILFDNCDFYEKLIIKDIEVNNQIFREMTTNKIEHLEIDNCIFHSSLNLEKSDLKHLSISSCEFNSSLNISRSIIKNFYLLETTLKKSFNAENSEFFEIEVNSTIFEKVVDFENSRFGEKNSSTFHTSKTSSFINTSFNGFINFTNTRFNSGLDFERVSLQEQPKFLNTIINQKLTGRETFRVIKNSFDIVGNKIEANHFYVKEMLAYKLELENQKNNYTQSLKFIKDIKNKAIHIKKIFINIESIDISTLQEIENYLSKEDLLVKNSFLKQNKDAFNTIENLIHQVRMEKLKILQLSNHESSNIRVLIAQIVDDIEKIEINIKKQKNKDKIIFDINNFISEFGNNFMRPIFLLVFFMVVFSLIQAIHSNPSKYTIISLFYNDIFIYVNNFAKAFVPFNRFFIEGMEFISLIFYIIFSILTWQTIVAIKRRVQR